MGRLSAHWIQTSKWSLEPSIPLAAHCCLHLFGRVGRFKGSNAEQPCCNLSSSANSLPMQICAAIEIAMPDASLLPEALRVRNNCPSLMGLVISFSLSYHEVMAHPGHFNRSWKQHVQKRLKLSRLHNVSGAAWPCVSRPCNHLLSLALGASRSRLLPHVTSSSHVFICPPPSIRTVSLQSALTPAPYPFLPHCIHNTVYL